jgi:cell wall-associated NlpC family hydrolase
VVPVHHAHTHPVVPPKHEHAHPVVPRKHVHTRPVVPPKHTHTAPVAPPKHTHTQPVVPPKHTHTHTQPVVPPKHTHTQPVAPPKHTHTHTQPVAPHHHARSTGGASIFTPPASISHLHSTAPHKLSPAPQAAPTAIVSAPTTQSTYVPAGDAAAYSRLSALLANGDQPPAFLIPIYKAAAHRYHVPWRILAAINFIESDYGRNMGTSSAGAVGWMQFMPSTWAEYGVDVDHRGAPNPYNPHDAIYAAARYLQANGARHDLRSAIFGYNHATWYVNEVMATAAVIGDNPVHADARTNQQLGAMLTMARLLNGDPYVWGGGHGGWQFVGGYDCSGFVSKVLHAAGYLSEPQTTQTLPSQPGILPGPGQFVTIFDRTDAGNGSDHVIIDINGQWWESGGSSAAGGGASVHRITDISPAYLATFNQILHPQGL